MAVFLCRRCGHVREVANDLAGRSVNCPRCKQTGAIHDTAKVLERLIAVCRTQGRELRTLRAAEPAPADSSQPANVEHSPLADIDIHDTTALADPRQFGPVLAWFEQRGIGVEPNPRALDTSGFFDEVAMQLGDRYETLKPVSDQIRYVQNRGYSSVKLTLSKRSQKEIGAITQFCRDLHQYSLVAKYFHQKNDKIVRLVLQTAPEIVKFFSGEWLEWYVLMKLLAHFRDRGIAAACLRNPVVTFPNEDVHELDVFFLVNDGVPLCIECKTGEFRQDIDKYARLAKRLNLDKEQFLICATGLDEKHIRGFNSMYGVTFANEGNFLEHVQRLAS